MSDKLQSPEAHVPLLLLAHLLAGTLGLCQACLASPSPSKAAPTKALGLSEAEYHVVLPGLRLQEVITGGGGLVSDEICHPSLVADFHSTTWDKRKKPDDSGDDKGHVLVTFCGQVLHHVP